VNITTRFSWIWGLLILLIAVTGCGNARMPTKVAAPPGATDTPAITNLTLATPDLARGQQVYLDKQCAACHGAQGQGGLNAPLAKTSLPFDQFLHKLRTAIPPKPAFNETELTAQDAYNMYGWLQNLEQGAVLARPTPALLPGQVLGMQVWTEGKCDSCHGAFAQGSPKGPTLVGLTFPYEMERAKMRQTAATIPEHAVEQMNDTLFQRLFKWLQAGANPGDGC
jgi:mono/diheme cytochrome c family protein